MSEKLDSLSTYGTGVLGVIVAVLPAINDLLQAMVLIASLAVMVNRFIYDQKRARRPMMLDVSLLKSDLTRDEGIKLKPYVDTDGKLTLGIGRNLDDVGISLMESDYLLTNDIGNVISSLDMAIPYWKDLSEPRQRALANMCFNMGLHGLLGFRDMLAAIRGGDFKTAAAAALNSDWAKQVGARAQRIAVLLEDG